MSIENYVDTVILPHLREVVLADLNRFLRVGEAKSSHLVQNTKDDQAPKDIVTISIDKPTTFFVGTNAIDKNVMESVGGTKEGEGWRFEKKQLDFVVRALKNNGYGYTVKHTLTQPSRPVVTRDVRLNPRSRDVGKHKPNKQNIKKIDEGKWMYVDTRLVLSTTDDSKGIIIGIMDRNDIIVPLTQKAISFCEANGMRYKQIEINDNVQVEENHDDIQLVKTNDNVQVEENHDDIQPVKTNDNIQVEENHDGI